MRKIVLSVLLLCLLSACAPSAQMSHYDTYRSHEHGAGPITAGKVRVIFLGTSTLLIDDGETQLLMDGFVTRPGLLKTSFGKIGCDTNKVRGFVSAYHVNRLRAVFCAHSHYDHAMDAPYVALKTGAALYGSTSTLNIGRGAGLPEQQMQVYQNNIPQHIGRFTVTVLPSKHTPPIRIMGKTNDDLGVPVTSPLRQPARMSAYSEGGAYDVLITHHGRSMLIKASTNWLPHALDGVHADILLLGMACLGKQDSTFRERYYRETVGKLKPQILVPIHWDNFFKPMSDHLKAIPKAADNVKLGFDYMIRHTRADSIQFRLMQGGESMEF